MGWNRYCFEYGVIFIIYFNEVYGLVNLHLELLKIATMCRNVILQNLKRQTSSGNARLFFQYDT